MSSPGTASHAGTPGTSPPMTAIADAIESRRADTSALHRAAGCGRHFSAGDDLSPPGTPTRGMAGTVEAFQRLTRRRSGGARPGLAVIDGVCIGGALEFAASCDLRLYTERVRRSLPRSGSASWPPTPARCCCPSCSARPRPASCSSAASPRRGLGAPHGFATELVPPPSLDDAHRALGRVFGRNSRAAVAATKGMLNARFGPLLEQAMARETANCVRLFDEPDAKAALRAFAAGRSGS